MRESLMLLPQMQIKADFTQPGYQSLWIGDSESVSLQFFADDIVGSDAARFWIQHATSQADDHFLETGLHTTINATDPVRSQILEIPYESTAGYIRIRVDANFMSSPGFSIRCQANLKGFRA